MKRIIYLLGLILLGTNLNGKEIAEVTGENDDATKKGKISGMVIDQTTKQPMEFANVALYNLNDSSLITGTITDESGEFWLDGISFGEYYIEAQFIGFNKAGVQEIVLSKDNPVTEPVKIELETNTLELAAVEVVADKAALEFKLDKKVVNVSQVISAVGGTAVDVLENTPSVQVDIEGNVSLRGSSNFTVLIDGRPSVLSGSDALRQIPASAIENIEIITNPSAKYEPDGMAGIINLVMKKNSLNGFSGIVNGTIGTRDKYRGDFTLNYRTNKANWFIGADWRDETGYGNIFSERETFRNDSVFYRIIDGERNDIRGGNNFKSGAEFFLTGKSTLGISGELGKSKNTRKGSGEMREFSNPVKLDIYSLNESESTRENDFYSLNMNFQHNFNTEGHKLDAMLFYSGEEGSDSENEAEILTDRQFVKTNIFIDRVSTLETEKENELQFKLDYTNPFSKNGKLEAGLQSRLERETEDLLFLDFNLASNTWVENQKYTSATDFRRDIHALYGTFSNKLGGIDYMAGLRGELTVREIKNTNSAKPHTLNRFDVFPTMHLSYKLKQTNEIMASYGRRINRPSGRDLDPNPNYFNRYTIMLGNPDLKPEYTNSYELNFLKRFGKSFLSAELFHRVTNNKIERIERLGEDGIFYLETDNFDKDYSTGVEIMGNVNFTKWLLVNGSVSMYNYRITGDLAGENFERESANWSGRLNATLKLAENSRMQIMGFYRGPSVSPQGESKAMIFSNLSFRQDFWDKKLSATLSLRDPFGTGKFERESKTPDFKSHFRWSGEPRVLMLTLSYKINNFKEERGNNGGGGEPRMDMGGEM